ncbi:MAG TPA: SycD/LcrH family type III secretion system chaperone [Trinickia sp.]|jgi:secretion system chaperone SscA|uniref:SycD/LcrH family type III secretion system chaperone n=1 Tax=Trinickia sp. TaxID=2571163 RepID=UPI002C1A0615|nr:SycD/LcrH family type III secretion system chaperone [Trinickia sp.]HTI18330.1 SycD/LcrH family type III secretion system chaperone [Trinickia sp.]
MTTPNSNAQSDDEVLQRFFARGGSVWMLADIAKEDLNTLYAYATQLFEAGEFAAARNVYLILARVDHWSFDYWFALGLCCQRLSAHEEAVFCFGRAGMIRIDDPRGSFFAGISYRALGNEAYAHKAFNAAIKWCARQPQYEEIRAIASEQLACCTSQEN